MRRPPRPPAVVAREPRRVLAVKPRRPDPGLAGGVRYSTLVVNGPAARRSTTVQPSGVRGYRSAIR